MSGVSGLVVTHRDQPLVLGVDQLAGELFAQRVLPLLWCLAIDMRDPVKFGADLILGDGFHLRPVRIWPDVFAVTDERR